MAVSQLTCVILTIFSIAINVNAVDVPYTINANEKGRFPDDFLFGASTAAFQIEGGWNASGKGPSIWDEFTHAHPEKVADHSNADVGPNSYEYYEDDIKAVKSLGMNFYRFSIAWSRVLPDGDIANINEAGIEYYNKVINKVLEYQLEPMVTIYHYDLPQDLQKFGGLTNSIIISYFEAYANLLFERYGDRVKYWITFNEPVDFCKGYASDLVAPAVNAHGIGEYLCGHNVIKSHAVVYHSYKENYYSRFKGQIGITLSSRFYYSAKNQSEDVDRAMQFSLGWFAHPIFSAKGNYPSIMTTQIASNSIREGRTWSRLPVFSEKWIETIKGSADFLGLNYYTARYVELLKTPEGINPSYERDIMMKSIVDPQWKRAASDWLYSVPMGIGDILRWIKEEYNNIPVIVTENGWSDNGDGLNDTGRIEYLRDHISQILNVVLNDECNIKGYTVWSIIDNFEWDRGYTEKFGLFAVNMTSPRRERTPKKSADFMRRLIESRQIPDLD